MGAKRKAQLRKDEEKAKCENELGILMERKNPCGKNHEPATLLALVTSLPCGGRQKSHGRDILAVGHIAEDRAECSRGSHDSEGRKKRGTPYKKEGVVEKIEAELAELMVKPKGLMDKRPSMLLLENLLNHPTGLGKEFTQLGDTKYKMGSKRMKKRAIGEDGALGLRKGLNSMYSSINQKKIGLGRQSNIQSSNLADTRREGGRPSDYDSDGTLPDDRFDRHFSLTPVRFDDIDSVQFYREPIPKRSFRKFRSEHGNFSYNKKIETNSPL
jgi:hypothetical protein